MQKILVHVAMVLLGVTLTVGFYEGRRLAKNTARAFSAATTMSTTGTKRSARETRLDPTEDTDDAAELQPQLQDAGSIGSPRAVGVDDLTARARMRDRKAARLGEGGVDPAARRGKRGKRGGGRRNGVGPRANGAGGLGPDALGADAAQRMGALEGRPTVGGQAPPEALDTGAP